MNCEDIALLLNDRDVRGLDTEQSQRVYAHLRKCAQCAAEWDAHARVLATPVAAMRPELERDVWHVVNESAAAEKSSRRRYVRPTLLGLVLAGAAAATLSLQWAPSSDDGSALAGDRWDYELAETETDADVGGAGRLAPFEGSFDGQLERDGALVALPQRRLLLLLPTLHETSDQRAIDDVNATRETFLRFMRDHTDFEIVEIDATQEADVPANLTLSYAFRWLTSFGTGPSLRLERDRVLGTHFGAENTVRFRSEKPRQGYESGWGVGSFVNRRGGGSYRSPFIEPWRYQWDWRERLARRLLGEQLRESLDLIHARLIADAELTDAERLEMLRERYLGLGWNTPRRYSISGEDLTLGPALDLARFAPAPETRRDAWEILGQTGDPAFAQFLLDALRSDRHATVRQTAAEGLYQHTNDPVVRAVLESAAAGDPSFAVREYARWPLMGVAERRSRIESNLRDPSLSLDERAVLLTLSSWYGGRSFFNEIAASNPDAPALLMDAARRSDDAWTRWRAISALQSSPVYVDLLLENLVALDETSRRQARSRLLAFAEQPRVLTALRDVASREPDSGFAQAVERALSPAPARPRWSRFWPF